MRRAHWAYCNRGLQAVRPNNAVRRDASPLECSGDFRHGLIGDSGYSLLCTHHDIQISTTRRVIAELEAKGLVTTVREDRGEFSSQYVKLTHFGWILNPQTGKADKAG